MIVVDTSALVAIARDEPERVDFSIRILRARSALVPMSAVLEAMMVMTGRSIADATPRLRHMLDDLGLTVASINEQHAWLAAAAFLRFGKGRHPAALNFGDCLSYALAKELDLPLLFKGDDFAKTDIRPALA